jgi:hypothetical protein
VAGNVEELLREAQHAFQNISPGSADEQKYTATAKRLALRIIRKSPDSSEGTQARMILYNLGSDEGLVLQRADTGTTVASKNTADKAGDEHSWANIWQMFSALSSPKKKVVALLLFFALLIIGFTPFLLLFFIFYLFQPAMIRKHIHGLLAGLG